MSISKRLFRSTILTTANLLAAYASTCLWNSYASAQSGSEADAAMVGDPIDRAIESTQFSMDPFVLERAVRPVLSFLCNPESQTGYAALRVHCRDGECETVRIRKSNDIAGNNVTSLWHFKAYALEVDCPVVRVNVVTATFPVMGKQ